jgi:molecular chaperone GrpE
MKKMSMNNTDTGSDAVVVLTETITQLEQQVQQLKEDALRSQADYQNLLRRTREERTQFVQFALKSCMEELLEPLEHLGMTADQLKNPVLNSVITQLWNVLQSQGLQEIEVLGKPYSLDTMEVVELVGDATETDGVVVKVVKRGYSLQGLVLQHAKVVIGKKN